jgi:hypothetical protein
MRPDAIPADLGTLAIVRPVTEGYQSHLIVYRDADETSSYNVAFEAALLLRIVQVPPEQRVNLTEKREAREKVVAQLEKMFKGSIGLAQARQAGLRFYDELMLQLRSIGPGLWADPRQLEQLPARSCGDCRQRCSRVRCSRTCPASTRR